MNVSKPTFIENNMYLYFPSKVQIKEPCTTNSESIRYFFDGNVDFEPDETSVINSMKILLKDFLKKHYIN